MSKIVKFNEVMHQWEGTAIVRTSEGLKEKDLGIMQSDKKLKEVGAKELFEGIYEAENSNDTVIAIEVKKICDILSTYEMDSEEFKKVAKLADTPSETASEEEQPNSEVATVVAHINM